MFVSPCRVWRNRRREIALTQLEVFLGGCEELGHSGCKRFAVNCIASAEEMLTDEERENINKMRVERDLLERQVIN